MRYIHSLVSSSLYPAAGAPWLGYIQYGKLGRRVWQTFTCGNNTENRRTFPVLQPFRGALRVRVCAALGAGGWRWRSGVEWRLRLRPGRVQAERGEAAAQARQTISSTRGGGSVSELQQGWAIPLNSFTIRYRAITKPIDFDTF
ncbi:hypothetical protein MHYP_G00007210 [Metynnis hypsauchen]